MCRKPKQPFKPKPRVNNVDDSISVTATVSTSATVGEQINHIDRLLQKHIVYDANYDSDYDNYDDNCVATINNNTREVEPVNLNSRIGKTSTKALVDSGSVCTIFNKNLATAVVSDCKECFWVQSPEMHELKTFSNDLIKTIGVIKTSVKCKDWVATGVNVTVVEDGHRPIIGRDLFPQLGLSLTQTKQVANADQNQCLIKKQIAFDFPCLISRIGKSLKHSVKSMFRKDFTPIHRKGRRVLINLQPLVNDELKKHTIKLNSCSDKNFISLNLDPETARHCNFNIFSGEGTGTYLFITGFYGLTDMPAAFQKVMDYTLVGLDNTHCFLDDIIIISPSYKEDHFKFFINV